MTDPLAVSWPPTLTALKRHMGVNDDHDDAVLQDKLNAAVAFVQDQHDGRYEFDTTFGLSDLPLPHQDMVEGTLMLARRLYERRNSPQGLITMGDLGSASIPGFDLDIERMLRLGRYAGSMIV